MTVNKDFEQFFCPEMQYSGSSIFLLKLLIYLFYDFSLPIEKYASKNTHLLINCLHETEFQFVFQSVGLVGQSWEHQAEVDY